MDPLEVLLDPVRGASDLRALREQSRLLEDLIDEVSRTRHGLQHRITAVVDVGSGGSAWRSPSSNAYDRQAEQTFRRLGDLLDLLGMARETVQAALARLAASGVV